MLGLTKWYYAGVDFPDGAPLADMAVAVVVAVAAWKGNWLSSPGKPRSTFGARSGSARSWRRMGGASKCRGRSARRLSTEEEAAEERNETLTKVFMPAEVREPPGNEVHLRRYLFPEFFPPLSDASFSFQCTRRARLPRRRAGRRGCSLLLLYARRLRLRPTYRRLMMTVLSPWISCLRGTGRRARKVFSIRGRRTESNASRRPWPIAVGRVGGDSSGRSSSPAEHPWSRSCRRDQSPSRWPGGCGRRSKSRCQRAHCLS